MSSTATTMLRTSPAKANWLDVFSPVFAFVLELQHSLQETRSAEPPQAATVMQRAREVLRQAEVAGRDCRFREDLVNQARFALVALIDELVLTSRWTMRDDWARQYLALEMFKESNAGEEFFNRMEALLRTSRPDPDVAGALEVYLGCLAFGFRGRCNDPSGQEELRELRERARRLLGEGKDPNRLAVNWQPQQSMAQRVRRLPTWTLVAGAAGLALLIWSGFELLTWAAADTLAGELRDY